MAKPSRLLSRGIYAAAPAITDDRSHPDGCRARSQLKGRHDSRESRSERFGQRVTGALEYLDDLPSGDCLHGKIVTLPVPAARIESIHKEKALRLEGVVAVYDLSDFKGRATRFGPLVKDRPILRDGATKYEGEPVVVVLAKRKNWPWRGFPCRDRVQGNAIRDDHCTGFGPRGPACTRLDDEER